MQVMRLEIKALYAKGLHRYRNVPMQKRTLHGIRVINIPTEQSRIKCSKANLMITNYHQQKTMYMELYTVVG